MQLSNIEFHDSLSGAFCRIREVPALTGDILNYVESRLAGEDGVCSENYAGADWDAAWKAYRARLNEVLDSVEKWDNT